MSDLPTVVTGAGLQPIAPADLRRMLVEGVAASNPGYTADLPGTLIEDIASTDVGALAQCDQFRVELVNSLTPNGANEFLLAQLATIYGVPRGGAANTSVQVKFTGSTGFVIPPGFIVTDGTFQYIIQNGGVVDDSIGGGLGVTTNLSSIANQAGSWAVPANTVNQLVTSVPTDIVLSVNNDIPGTPATSEQTVTEWRTQVLRAGLAATQGMARYLKTLLRNVSGVQERLISVRQKAPNDFGCGAWEVIVGGSGNNYDVANAIFNAIFDVSSLRPSEIRVTGITNAAAGVVTTDINHLYDTGDIINIEGVEGMTGVNDHPLTVTVISSTSFSINVNTTSSGTWTGGGVCTPNARNVQVYIDDYPDTYLIPFVVPPAQDVHIFATWNTSAPNFVGAASVAALTTPALVNYINGIPAGQPVNLYELENAFRDAVSVILTPQQLTKMDFDVSIDGIAVSPISGTGIIPGDPESYLVATQASVQVVQG